MNTIPFEYVGDAEAVPLYPFPDLSNQVGTTAPIAGAEPVPSGSWPSSQMARPGTLE